MLSQEQQKKRSIFIEIQEFYPQKTQNKYFKGTLHIYLDIDGLRFDMRGLPVFKNGKRPVVCIYENYIFEDGKKIRYPLLSFHDQEVHDFLHLFLKNEASEYVQKKLNADMKNQKKPKKCDIKCIKDL